MVLYLHCHDVGMDWMDDMGVKPGRRSWAATKDLRTEASPSQDHVVNHTRALNCARTLRLCDPEVPEWKLTMLNCSVSTVSCAPQTTALLPRGAVSGTARVQATRAGTPGARAVRKAKIMRAFIASVVYDVRC